MDAIKEIHPRYVTDEAGHKQAVVLDLADYEALMEFVEDRNDAIAFDAAVNSSTGMRDLADVVADLKRDGLL